MKLPDDSNELALRLFMKYRKEVRRGLRKALPNGTVFESMRGDAEQNLYEAVADGKVRGFIKGNFTEDKLRAFVWRTALNFGLKIPETKGYQDKDSGQSKSVTGQLESDSALTHESHEDRLARQKKLDRATDSALEIIRKSRKEDRGILRMLCLQLRTKEDIHQITGLSKRKITNVDNRFKKAAKEAREAAE